MIEAEIGRYARLKPPSQTLMGDKKRPFFKVDRQTLGNEKSVGRTMMIFGQNNTQSAMIYPQTIQKWYNKVARFPLWITAVGTGAFAFEALKQAIPYGVSTSVCVGTGAFAFEALKRLTIFTYDNADLTVGTGAFAFEALKPSGTNTMKML